MLRILFVCHGNICRSPLGKYLMRRLVREEGLEDRFFIDSAATSTEELGEGVYPPMRRLLKEAGIDCSDHAAKRMTRRDYETYDLLIGMDRWNVRNMERICGGDPARKIHILTEWTGGGEIDDPWYTRDFRRAWREIEEGCSGLLEELKRKGWS